MNFTSSPYGADLHLPVTSRRERRQRGNPRAPFSLRSPALRSKKASRKRRSKTFTEAADVGKGTFFNYFPSKDHIPHRPFRTCRLANSSRQSKVSARPGNPCRNSSRGLGSEDDEEPVRNPALIRALLQAYLSTTAVREEMIQKQDRAHGFTNGWSKSAGAGRNPQRHSCCGNCALFSADNSGYVADLVGGGDSTLRERIDSALKILWRGIASAKFRTEPARRKS